MNNFKDSTYLFGSNANFIENLYKQYLANPKSIDASWHEIFSEEKACDSKLSHNPNPTCSNNIDNNSNASLSNVTNLSSIKEQVWHSEVDDKIASIKRSIAVNSLVTAYREMGHMEVKLDPLKLSSIKQQHSLNYKNYGISESELSEPVVLNNVFNLNQATVGDVINLLKKSYSSRIGYEFYHILNTEEREWFIENIEQNLGFIEIDKEEKLKALFDIVEVETFENYLHTKFPGAKRFSIEGSESSIAAIITAISELSAIGAKDIVIGMAHRGRLSTLTKIMEKPYSSMLAEFLGTITDINILPGDVKYHVGISCDKVINGNPIHLSLTPNPSHLETVNPVVLGRVKAKQDLLNNEIDHYNSVIPILVHGDSSVIGQGSVMESLMLSQLNAYKVGGALHIVINNQVGFTTNPTSSRFGLYCTDIAKSINAPIIHVSGEDVEAVIYATKLAVRYREKFKKDIFLDVVGYRKYGHNEGDEPYFTQPKMYSKINDKEWLSTPKLYANHLIEQGILSQDKFIEKQIELKNLLDGEYELAKNQKLNPPKISKGNWDKYSQTNSNIDSNSIPKTGIKLAELKDLSKKLCNVPSNFDINSKIKRQLEAREKAIESESGIDWGTAESLAFASLLSEGYNIRFTGQDVERGTFSHRHAVWTDQVNEKKYIPLNNIYENQKAKIKIHNSNLSELAVLGFEYGYSFSSPESLVIWEAQFGDFANGAQVIIDQYIASGEAKWLRMSGLVMLLPHGYEGQGPEHSSARLERFLQLCANNNIQVCNCTTPASFFHLLRKQMHQKYRKPLVIMTPKSLLRHKLAVSNFSEMVESTHFNPLIVDKISDNSNKDIKKIIICSGKVYYDLYEKLASIKKQEILLLRLEQLYPFPKEQVKEVFLRYPNASIIWCQEEHYNMGAFQFISFYINDILKDIKHIDRELKYVGRLESASPAVGYNKVHVTEQESFLKEALEY